MNGQILKQMMRDQQEIVRKQQEIVKKEESLLSNERTKVFQIQEKIYNLPIKEKLFCIYDIDLDDYEEDNFPNLKFYPTTIVYKNKKNGDYYHDTYDGCFTKDNLKFTSCSFLNEFIKKFPDKNPHDITYNVNASILVHEGNNPKLEWYDDSKDNFRSKHVYNVGNELYLCITNKSYKCTWTKMKF